MENDLNNSQYLGNLIENRVDRKYNFINNTIFCGNGLQQFYYVQFDEENQEQE